MTFNEIIGWLAIRICSDRHEPRPIPQVTPNLNNQLELVEKHKTILIKALTIIQDHEKGLKERHHERSLSTDNQITRQQQPNATAEIQSILEETLKSLETNNLPDHSTHWENNKNFSCCLRKLDSVVLVQLCQIDRQVGIPTRTQDEEAIINLTSFFLGSSNTLLFNKTAIPQTSIPPHRPASVPLLPVSPRHFLSRKNTELRAASVPLPSSQESQPRLIMQQTSFD